MVQNIKENKVEFGNNQMNKKDFENRNKESVKTVLNGAVTSATKH